MTSQLLLSPESSLRLLQLIQLLELFLAIPLTRKSQPDGEMSLMPQFANFYFDADTDAFLNQLGFCTSPIIILKEAPRLTPQRYRFSVANCIKRHCSTNSFKVSYVN